MISISIVLSIVESQISILFFTFPGMKLGLANIATMVVVYTLDRKSGVTLAILRIFIVGLIYSGFNPTFWFSLSGGLLSLLVLISLKGIKKLSIYSVSVLASMMHMVGQLIAAVFVAKTASLFYYLPYMLLISIPTGIITAYLAKKIITDLSEKLMNYK